MSVLYHDTSDNSQPIPTSKPCSKCGIEKPLEEFYRAPYGLYGRQSQCKTCCKNPRNLIVQPPLFILSQYCKVCGIEKHFECFDRDPNMPYGRKKTCKVCVNARRRERCREKKPSLPPLPPNHKKCSKCQEIKHFECFYSDPRKKDGLECWCKGCKKKHFKRNPERAKEYHQIRRVTHAQQIRDTQKRYYEANRDEIRRKEHMRYQANQEKRREQGHEYYTKNRLKAYEKNKRRLAIQKGVTVEKVSYTRILERDGYWCHICEQDILPGQKLHFDHVIPLTRGGSHTYENIKVSHGVCNIRKHNHLMEELTVYQRRGPW